MSKKETPEVVVPRENAVFRLDAHGRWHNQHGAFEHKKIIDYFHASIRWDAGGYHLFQKHGDRAIEKVYFTYEDTALFVFDLIHPEDAGEIHLILNTKQEIPLNPGALFIQDDNLYLEHDRHRIKFIDRALLKLAPRLQFDQQHYQFELGGKTYDIPIRPSSGRTEK